MKNILIPALIAAFVGGGIVLGFGQPSTQQITQKHESIYDRVMRTGVIRCGYALWPPHALLKDPKTGDITGFFPEIIETAAKNMGLKIEWAEETGWGSFIEALKADRFDAFCAPLWRNGERGVHIEYTVPMFYSAVHLYARGGDRRFDDDLSKLNSPDIRLSTMDGEMSHMIARKYFPKANTMAITQMGDITHLMMNVATGKADAVFIEPGMAKNFMKNNPQYSMRKVTETPFQVFPNSLGVRLGETKFRLMLDSAFTELVNHGIVRRIIDKYEPDQEIFMPVSRPYELPEKK